MKKTSPFLSLLPIRTPINVIRARNPHCRKRLSVPSRRSDGFVYVVSGSCDYHFDHGEDFTARAGQVIYLAQRAHYDMWIHDENYLVIYCDFFFSSDEPRSSQLFSFANPSPVETLFQRLHSTYDSHSPGGLALSLSLLYQIYSALLRANQPSSSLSARGERLKEKLRTRFSDPSLSLELLADEEGISSVTMRKLFWRELNCSPSAYLLSLRINEAKRLLESPFLRLEDCALQSGFTTAAYFCRVFKKETGVSPGEYRRLLQSGKKPHA